LQPPEEAERVAAFDRADVDARKMAAVGAAG
jgi:hypothetical protein